MFGKFQFARLSTLFQNVAKDGSQASRALDLAGKSVEELAILSEREMKKIEDLGFFPKLGIAGQEFGAGFFNETSARVEQGKQALENLKQRYAEAEAARLGIKNPSKVKIPEKIRKSVAGSLTAKLVFPKILVERAVIQA